MVQWGLEGAGDLLCGLAKAGRGYFLLGPHSAWGYSALVCVTSSLRGR